MAENYKCCKCDREVKDYTPELCCNGNDCGCLGLPIEPPICRKCDVFQMYGDLQLQFLEFSNNTVIYEGHCGGVQVRKIVFGSDLYTRKFKVGDVTTINEPEPQDILVSIKTLETGDLEMFA